MKHTSSPSPTNVVALFQTLKKNGKVLRFHLFTDKLHEHFIFSESEIVRERIIFRHTKLFYGLLNSLDVALLNLVFHALMCTSTTYTARKTYTYVQFWIW